MALERLVSDIVIKHNAEVFEILGTSLEEAWDACPVVVKEVEGRRRKTNGGGTQDDRNDFRIV